MIINNAGYLFIREGVHPVSDNSFAKKTVCYRRSFFKGILLLLRLKFLNSAALQCIADRSRVNVQLKKGCDFAEGIERIQFHIFITNYLALDIWRIGPAGYVCRPTEQPLTQLVMQSFWTATKCKFLIAHIFDGLIDGPTAMVGK